MNNILMEEKYLLEYIRDILSSFKCSSTKVNDAKYHHNSSYSNAISICKTGILTINDLVKMNIRNYSQDFLEKMSNIESHANGVDAVSLAIVGLQDLYPNEFEYYPFNPELIDFLVSSDVRAGRYSENYGNEFLSYSSIGIDKLRSIDIRLLSLISLIENKKNHKQYSTQEIIDKFNCLREIALIIKSTELDISLREMSDENDILLDIDKVSITPRLVLK